MSNQENVFETILAPMTGTAVAITEVPDPIFIEKILGDGVAIVPTEGKVVSPVDGTVSKVAETGHIYAVTSDNGVEVVTGAKVTGYRDGILTADVAGKIREIPCDSVVLSVGYREENSLYQELEFEVPEIYLLGDAKKVANIMYAIWDAFEVANHI